VGNTERRRGPAPEAAQRPGHPFPVRCRPLGSASHPGVAPRRAGSRPGRRARTTSRACAGAGTAHDRGRKS